jgi:hypothetical protein
VFTKVLTRSGNDDDPNPVGLGFYYIDDNQQRYLKLVSARCLTTFIENSKYKRRCVFYDRDGKAVSTGWMMW